MDISSMSLSPTNIAQLATSMGQEKANGAIGVAVLKQALDIQEQSAIQLVQSIPQVPTGGSIDVTA